MSDLLTTPLSSSSSEDFESLSLAQNNEPNGVVNLDLTEKRKQFFDLRNKAIKDQANFDKAMIDFAKTGVFKIPEGI